VDTDEICNYIYDPDGPINQWLNRQGVTRTDTTDGICLGVGISSAIITSETGLGAALVGAVAATLCEGGQYACKIEEFVAELSGCGTVEFDIYLATDVQVTARGHVVGTPIIVVPKCSSLTLEDVLNAAESAGANLLNAGEDLLHDIESGASECADDLFECGEDAVDQGADQIGL
jgi:hypothetical protein